MSPTSAALALSSPPWLCCRDFSGAIFLSRTIFSACTNSSTCARLSAFSCSYCAGASSISCTRRFSSSNALAYMFLSSSKASRICLFLKSFIGMTSIYIFIYEDN